MLKRLIKGWLLISGLFLPLALQAATAWQIVPDVSNITFTATQNNAPVAGKFTRFAGDIEFDPQQLASSHVSILVDINSLTTSYPEVADTLKTADWFDVKLFPQAKFIANKFVKTGENSYQAEGYLTLRDKTLPLIVSFDVEKYSATEFKANGTSHLRRTEFGLGQGDWAKTDTIKDEVQLSFVLQAVAKKE